MITGVDLFGYTVRDAAKTIAFYRDVLGMKPTMENEQGAEFTLLASQKTQVGDDDKSGRKGNVRAVTAGAAGGKK